MAWLAQGSRKKSAEKSYYPVISLLGSIGLESLSTGNFLEGGSRTFSIGPRITWPIFNSGAIRKDIRIHSAREEQYFAAYEAGANPVQRGTYGIALFKALGGGWEPFTRQK